MFLELRLRRIRVREQKKLNVSNLYLYRSITSYIQNSGLREIEKEEILHQVMDMLLQAQMEGKSAELIVGKDYEEFCKAVIKEYGSGKSAAYKALDYLQKYMLWMLFISAFIAVMTGIARSSVMGISIDQLLTANIISLVIIPLSKRKRQETSSIYNLYYKFYILNYGTSKWDAYAFGGIIGITLISRLIIGRIFGEQVFRSVIRLSSIIPYGIIILVVILAIEAYKRFYDKR